MLVARIGPEVAFPFVRAYCHKWGIPIANEHAADTVTWWGALYRSKIRAVMGFVDLDTDDDALFVYGMYGDGSPFERRAIFKLVQCIDALPNHLYGTIHLPNIRMYRAAGKHGWNISKLLPDNQAALVEREAVS